MVKGRSILIKRVCVCGREKAKRIEVGGLREREERRRCRAWLFRGHGGLFMVSSCLMS